MIVDCLRELELAPEPAGLFVAYDGDELVDAPVNRLWPYGSTYASTGVSAGPLAAVVVVVGVVGNGAVCSNESRFSCLLEDIAVGE